MRCSQLYKGAKRQPTQGNRCAGENLISQMQMKKSKSTIQWVFLVRYVHVMLYTITGTYGALFSLKWQL